MTATPARRRLRALVVASAVASLMVAVEPAGDAAASSASTPASGTYTSPYEVSGINPAFTTDLAARIASYAPTQQSAAVPTTFPAVADWYSQSIYGSPSNASWGAAPLVLPRPLVPSGLSTDGIVDFYEQRIVAAASSLIGTAYQHHHLPFWNPYANGFTPYLLPSPIPAAQPVPPTNQWPWSAVSTNTVSQQYAPVLSGSTWVMTQGTPFANPYASQYGTGAAGIDCSDLTSFVYSVAAGIYLNSAVGEQGVVGASGVYSGPSTLGWNDTPQPLLVDPALPTDADVTSITPTFILGPNSTYNAATNSRGIDTFNTPGSLDGVVAQLKPGDLLYVANTPDAGSKVTHVVIWLGKYGTVVDPNTGSVSKVPLVLSSHDNTPVVLDADSNLPALGQGNMPPPGVQILPFAQNSWFYSNFSHAMRVVTAATASSGRPENPVAARVVATGVLLVGERVADRTDPRLMLHSPARIARAPIVSWRTHRPISLTARGLRTDATFDVRLRTGGRSVAVGQMSSDANGETRLPVITLTRTGTYTFAIVDRVTDRTRYLRIHAAD